jgi:hypothetical protein
MRPLGDYQKIRALVGWFPRNRHFQARRASLLYVQAVKPEEPAARP